MKHLRIDANHIDHSLIKDVAETIVSGGIVALATDTVYGLAGRADNPDTVNRLYELKKRPKDKPFTYVVADVSSAIKMFTVLPPFGYRLMEQFWPGPLTLVYQSTFGDTIGVRVPDNSVTSEILRLVNCPVYLPSANISGAPEAIDAKEVASIFGDKIDIMIEQDIQAKPASTVLDITPCPFRILREGAIPKREIIRTFSRKRLVFVCTGNTCRSPLAQMLLQKYLLKNRPYLKEHYEIISRGVSAIEGSFASSTIIDLLAKKEQLSANNFSSRQLDREMILSADYIFTMEKAHSEYIKRHEPTSIGRVFTLGKFLPVKFDQDIPDPMGGGQLAYENAYELIRQAVIELTDWL